MITKGIRISQLVERKDLNGKEIIPFQDGIHNGKMSIDSLIDYIGDVSDSDIDLQSLVKIQEFVDTVSEMNTLLYQAKENDIYYCKENKKLYIRRFNEWEIIDPLNSKVYVLVGLDEYNRTNIIHLWDGNDMVVMSERLFLGETTGTAYDGGKGKKTTDIVNSLPKYIPSTQIKLSRSSGGNIIIGSHHYEFNNTTNVYESKPFNDGITFPIVSKTESGVMSAADKVKLDETLPNRITELSNNVYTKEEINNKFDNVPTVENTYTKAEVDKAIADAIKALIPAGYELVIKKKTT